MRNIRRRSSSSMPLKCAMRSWMSIAVATAATAESNSASTELPADVHHRPPRAFDGGPPDVGLDRLQMADRAVLAAFHQAHEAAEVGVQDGGKPAARVTWPVVSSVEADRARQPRPVDVPQCLLPAAHCLQTGLRHSPASPTVRHRIVRRYRPRVTEGTQPEISGAVRCRARRHAPARPRSRTTIRPRPWSRMPLPLHAAELPAHALARHAQHRGKLGVGNPQGRRGRAVAVEQHRPAAWPTVADRSRKAVSAM